MPIGKDSITKRVAKTAPAKEVKEESIAPELVATTAAAPVAPAKKSCKTKKTTQKKTTPKVSTNVLTSVAPETVEAVVGHKENDAYEKVGLGEDLPVHLL